jgi:hypothetical protein
LELTLEDLALITVEIKAFVAGGGTKWKEVKCAHYVALDDTAGSLPENVAASTMRTSLLFAWS